MAKRYGDKDYFNSWSEKYEWLIKNGVPKDEAKTFDTVFSTDPKYWELIASSKSGKPLPPSPYWFANSNDIQQWLMSHKLDIPTAQFYAQKFDPNNKKTYTPQYYINLKDKYFRGSLPKAEFTSEGGVRIKPEEDWKAAPGDQIPVSSMEAPMSMPEREVSSLRQTFPQRTSIEGKKIPENIPKDGGLWNLVDKLDPEVQDDVRRTKKLAQTFDITEGQAWNIKDQYGEPERIIDLANDAREATGKPRMTPEDVAKELDLPDASNLSEKAPELFPKEPDTRNLFQRIGGSLGNLGGLFGGKPGEQTSPVKQYPLQTPGQSEFAGTALDIAKQIALQNMGQSKLQSAISAFGPLASTALSSRISKYLPGEFTGWAKPLADIGVYGTGLGLSKLFPKVFGPEGVGSENDAMEAFLERQREPFVQQGLSGYTPGTSAYEDMKTKLMGEYQSRMGAVKQQYELGKKGISTGMLGSLMSGGMQPQFENVYHGRQPGMWENIGVAAAGAAPQALATLGSAYLTGGASQTPQLINALKQLFGSGGGLPGERGTTPPPVQP